MKNDGFCDLYRAVYKSFKNKTVILSDDECETILKALTTYLSKKQYEVIIEKFGLKSGTPKSLHDLSERFNRTDAYVKRIEQTAIHKLRKEYALPKKPCNENEGIERLDLDPISYNCLKRAGVNKISDILLITNSNYDMCTDTGYFRYLHRSQFDNIEKAMRSVGYDEFKLSLS